MFLNEVALGKEFNLFCDDSSLKSAPSGHDSVVAWGHTEPSERERERERQLDSVMMFQILAGLE